MKLMALLIVSAGLAAAPETPIDLADHEEVVVISPQFIGNWITCDGGGSRFWC